LNNFDQIVIHENTSSNNFQEFFFLSTNIKLSIWLIKENIQFHCKLSDIFVVVEANEMLNKPDLRKKKGDLKGSYFSCF
jgi:hypothetical protein